ncbi:MAG: hypothetical protein KJO06_09565 [Gemmatimonadetes bacterium]|nr:hypothetical protein [Gemmatimonadota bacterium]
MSLATFIRTVAGILEKAHVPYMLTGSLAAAYYATPRATQDVDVVIDTPKEGIERLVRGLLDSGFYVDRAAALSAWRTRSQFNAIDPDSGWKVDLIVRKDRAFSEVEFKRRERAEVLGLEVSMASLEDVILAKLEWAKMGDSELQRTDVVRLLERAGDRLDQDYVEAWVRELDLKSEWDAVLGRLSDTQPEA